MSLKTQATYVDMSKARLLFEKYDLDSMKNKIIKKMEIEENIGNNINILEFKK